MKKLMILLITLLPLFVFSQGTSIGYEYDAAGNRVLRYVIDLPVTLDPESNDDSALKTVNDSVANHEFTIDNLEVVVYPNPNGGKFDVEIKSNISSQTLELNIFSLNGTNILAKKIINKRTTIDITDRENGVYILTLVVGDLKKTITLIKN